MEPIIAEPSVVESHHQKITATNPGISSGPIKAARKAIRDSNGTGKRRKSNELGEVLPGRFSWVLNSNAPTVPVRARYSASRRRERKEVKALGVCLRCKKLKKKVNSPAP
jgi:hypothetical protein